MDNKETVSQMLAKATAKMRGREITRIWKSVQTDLETLEHTNEPVGVQVELEVSHDQRNKQFVATLRKIHWKPSDSNANIMITFMSPFDKVNYPFVTLMRLPVSRYSDKALKAFEQSVIAQLPTIADQSPTVAQLVGVANTLA